MHLNAQTKAPSNESALILRLRPLIVVLAVSSQALISGRFRVKDEVDDYRMADRPVVAGRQSSP
jgi:hypothetical protein